MAVTTNLNSNTNSSGKIKIKITINFYLIRFFADIKTAGITRKEHTLLGRGKETSVRIPSILSRTMSRTMSRTKLIIGLKPAITSLSFSNACPMAEEWKSRCIGVTSRMRNRTSRRVLRKSL